MKTFKLFFLSILLMGQLSGVPLLTPEALARQHREPLVRVFEYRDLLKGVHPFVGQFFSKAETTKDQFFIFALDSSQSQYRTKIHKPTNAPVPGWVRTAFPLGFYQGKATCIVTGDVFSTPLGPVTIFYEFIFFNNGKTYEFIRYGKQHQFGQPVSDQTYFQDTGCFSSYYESKTEQIRHRLMRALRSRDEEAIWLNQMALRQIIGPSVYAQWIGQLWEKGLVRYIENNLRQQQGLLSNPTGCQNHFDQHIFYEEGETFIRFLVEQNPYLAANPEALFKNMSEILALKTYSCFKHLFS